MSTLAAAVEAYCSTASPTATDSDSKDVGVDWSGGQGVIRLLSRVSRLLWDGPAGPMLGVEYLSDVPSETSPAGDAEMK